jgi:hypothetical protein
VINKDLLFSKDDTQHRKARASLEEQTKNREFNVLDQPTVQGDNEAADQG